MTSRDTLGNRPTFAEQEAGGEAYLPISTIPTPLQAHRGEILSEMQRAWKRRQDAVATAREQLLAAGVPEDRLDDAIAAALRLIDGH